MSRLDDIIEAYPDEEFLSADGFDEAILGVVYEMNRLPRIAYSVSKCIEVLMREMDYEEAREYFDFNVSGAYVGEKTPLWVEDDSFCSPA